MGASALPIAMRIGPLLVAGLTLAIATATAVNAAFPGRNGRIAFTRDAPTGTFITTIRPDGRKRRKLGVGADPAFSSDGRKIAYVAGSSRPSIRVMHSDGTHKRSIDSGHTDDYFPAWSPNGTKLAFESVDAKGMHHIVVMDADGRHRHTLTPALNGSHPSWSPNGLRIAFDSYDFASSQTTLWIVRANGTAAHQITHGSDDLEPNWSPNGLRLVFMASDPVALFRIDTVRADGTHRHRLGHETVREADPVYSPDGRRIAFTRGAGSSTSIWLMKADGSGRRALTSPHTPVHDYGPAWQPIP
jgi:Tol biopolymer transport system component